MAAPLILEETTNLLDPQKLANTLTKQFNEASELADYVAGPGKIEGAVFRSTGWKKVS